MQSVRSRIWTRVAVSISYDDNDCTTGTSNNWWYAIKPNQTKTNQTIPNQTKLNQIIPNQIKPNQTKSNQTKLMLYHFVILQFCAVPNRKLTLAPNKIERKWKVPRPWKWQVYQLYVIGTFGTVTKWLLKGLEDLKIRGRAKTIQTTTLLRTGRILRRVLET